MQILNEKLLDPLRDSKLLLATLSCVVVTFLAYFAMGPTTCPPIAGPMAATWCFAFMTVARNKPEDVTGHVKSLAVALAVLAVVDAAQFYPTLFAARPSLALTGFFLASLATAAFAILACAVGLLLETNPLTDGLGMTFCASGLLNGPLIWLVHPFRDDGPSHVGYLEPLASGWPLVFTVVLALGVFLLAAGATGSLAKAARLNAELRDAQKHRDEEAEKEKPKQPPYRPRPHVYSPERPWAKPDTAGVARREATIEEILGRKAAGPKAEPVQALELEAEQPEPEQPTAEPASANQPGKED